MLSLHVDKAQYGSSKLHWPLIAAASIQSKIVISPIERPAARVVLLKIAGTDMGEFVDAPTKALNDWIEGAIPIHLFIDARDVRERRLGRVAERAKVELGKRHHADRITFYPDHSSTSVTAGVRLAY